MKIMIRLLSFPLRQPVKLLNNFLSLQFKFHPSAVAIISGCTEVMKNILHTLYYVLIKKDVMEMEYFFYFV